MRTLHMMMGLPRAGKSTVARKLGHPVVCPDALRAVLHGTPFRPEIEPLVWALADTMVKALFAAGHDDVTVDACNCTSTARRQWFSQEWATTVYFVATPVAECLRRARKNKQPYLLPVIKKLAGGFDAYALPGEGRWRRIGGARVRVMEDWAAGGG